MTVTKGGLQTIQLTQSCGGDGRRADLQGENRAADPFQRTLNGGLDPLAEPHLLDQALALLVAQQRRVKGYVELTQIGLNGISMLVVLSDLAPEGRADRFRCVLESQAAELQFHSDFSDLATARPQGAGKRELTHLVPPFRPVPHARASLIAHDRAQRRAAVFPRGLDEVISLSSPASSAS